VRDGSVQFIYRRGFVALWFGCSLDDHVAVSFLSVSGCLPGRSRRDPPLTVVFGGVASKTARHPHHAIPHALQLLLKGKAAFYRPGGISVDPACLPERG
jgi:hypothetical protein